MQGRFLQNCAIFLIFQLLFSGCASYKRHACTLEEKKPEPPLYKIIPRHRCQIRWFDAPHWAAWAVFGNDDDGIFGECSCKIYKAHKKNNLGKALNWWLRNPFHNFFHYGIGSAQRKNSAFTFLNLNSHGVKIVRYQPCATKNYGCNCTSFLFTLHGGKPFISLRLRYTKNTTSEFYLGWRKNGAFGVKACLMKKNCSNSFL